VSIQSGASFVRACWIEFQPKESLMHTKWRIRMAIGLIVGAAVLYPPIALAQESQPNTPSGGVVSVGGVTPPQGGPSGAPAAVSGAQGRPLVLPNTGGGPAPSPDGDGLVAIIAGAAAAAGLVLASGALHLRRRGSRPRVGG
jgi:hypothetical protein